MTNHISECSKLAQSIRGARGVMGIVVENGHGGTSSNPGRG